jgi:hypothetical protein
MIRLLPLDVSVLIQCRLDIHDIGRLARSYKAISHTWGLREANNRALGEFSHATGGCSAHRDADNGRCIGWMAYATGRQICVIQVAGDAQGGWSVAYPHEKWLSTADIIRRFTEGDVTREEVIWLLDSMMTWLISTQLPNPSSRAELHAIFMHLFHFVYLISTTPVDGHGMCRSAYARALSTLRGLKTSRPGLHAARSRLVEFVFRYPAKRGFLNAPSD